MKPCIAFALIVALPPAHAGVAYEVSTRDLTTDNAEPVITHGYAQDGRLRIEQSGKSHFVTIQTKQAEIDIDPSTRSYQVRDQEELMRIGAQESTNHDKNVARSAAFPADTPANLRVMPDQMNASADENLAIQKQPPDYRATYRHETVDGYVCSIWEYYWKGSKQAEYCIAPPALIPGGTEWMAALRAEGDFYESASQWLGDPGRLILAPTRPQAEAPSRLDGILLMIRSFNQGKAASESRVITERVEQLKPELFDVPKDYQRK